MCRSPRPECAITSLASRGLLGEERCGTQRVRSDRTAGGLRPHFVSRNSTPSQPPAKLACNVACTRPASSSARLPSRTGWGSRSSCSGTAAASMSNPLEGRDWLKGEYVGVPPGAQGPLADRAAEGWPRPHPARWRLAPESPSIRAGPSACSGWPSPPLRTGSRSRRMVASSSQRARPCPSTPTCSSLQPQQLSRARALLRQRRRPLNHQRSGARSRLPSPRAPLREELAVG